jgi:hypothetical protein
LLWIIFVVGFAIAIWSARTKQQAKDEARKQYDSALSELKKQPDLAPTL